MSWLVWSTKYLKQKQRTVVCFKTVLLEIRDSQVTTLTKRVWYLYIVSRSEVPVPLILKTENWRSLETANSILSSWENSICVIVKLWDCKRLTAFHEPTSQSHISATDADCACTFYIVSSMNYTTLMMIKQQINS